MLRLIRCTLGYVFRKVDSTRNLIYSSLVTAVSIVFFIPIVLLHLARNILNGRHPQHGVICSHCTQHHSYSDNASPQPHKYTRDEHATANSSVSNVPLQHGNYVNTSTAKSNSNLAESDVPTIRVASFSPSESRTKESGEIKPLRTSQTGGKPIVPTQAEIQHVKLMPHRPSIVMQTHEQKRRLSAIAMDPNSMRRPSNVSPNAPAPPPPPPGSSHRALVPKMKSFYWNKIQPQAISTASAWSTKIFANTIPIKSEEIQHLFKNVVQEPKPHNDDKKVVVSILDAKKAHNMSILLSQIKEASDAEIRKNIMNGEQGSLTKEHLELLSKFEPTEDEINSIMHFTGDINALGRSEKYFREVLQGHRFVQKLGVLVLKSKFNSRIAHLRTNLALIEQATIELTCSSRFLTFLGAVLGIGNHLNSGGRLGNAQAFHLDSLSKISDTRIQGGKQNLLHYIISVMQTHDKDALNWPEDMPALSDVAKVPFETIISGLHSIKKDLKKIDHELHGDDPESQRFRDVMQEFEDHALEETADLDMHMSSLQENLAGMFEFFADDVRKAHDMHAVHEWFEMLANFSQSFLNARHQLEPK